MKTRFLKPLKRIARKNCFIQFYPRYKTYVIIKRVSRNHKYLESYSSVQHIYKWQNSILDATHFKDLNTAIKMLSIARNHLTQEYGQKIRAYLFNKMLKKL